jgi:tight adherence protein B
VAERFTQRALPRRPRTAGVVRSGRPAVLALAVLAIAPGGAIASTPTVPATGGSRGSVILVLAAAALVGAAVALIARRPSLRAARARVGSFVPAAGGEDEATLADDTSKRPLAALSHGAWWTGFQGAVEISRSTRSAGYLMKRAGLGALLAALLLVPLTHQPLIAFVPLITFPFVERWWVMRAAQKQRDRFGESLPGYMQDMASTMRVGRSFVDAMAVIADGAEEPIRSELERAVADESFGRPLDQSLAAVGQRMGSVDIEQVALIAELNRRSGSNVAEALERVAEGARDRADLRREVRALTAQAKMSSSVLTGLPVVLLLGLSLIAPSYSHPLFHTTGGIISLVVAAALVFAGWKVMKQISTVKV